MVCDMNFSGHELGAGHVSDIAVLGKYASGIRSCNWSIWYIGGNSKFLFLFFSLRDLL